MTHNLTQAINSLASLHHTSRSMFAAVQRMRKLEDATNAKDEPAPGMPSMRSVLSTYMIQLHNPRPFTDHISVDIIYLCQIAVYLLEEICQMTQGGQQEVGAIVQFVITRLTAKPAVVKQKVPPSSSKLTRAPTHRLPNSPLTCLFYTPQYIIFNSLTP